MNLSRTPSGRWRAIVQVEGRRQSATFDDAYEAERWADQIERPEAYAPTASDDQTAVIVYGRAWLARVAPLLTQATVENYSTALRAIEVAPFAATALGDLRRSQVEGWISDLAAEGRLGASSIRLRLKVLRMVLRDAQADRLIDRDPTYGVRMPTVPIKVDKVIDPADDERLLGACDTATRAMLLLGIDAGLRWSEAAALAADAIDLRGGYLIVRQVIERSPHRVRPYPKGHRSRVVPILTDRLEDALRAALATDDGSGPIFRAEQGGLLDYAKWRQRTWNPTVRRAGFRARIGFHSTRHTCGSRLAAGGMPTSQIAAILGHADERTTQRYVHVGHVDGLRQSGRDALAAHAARQALAA